MKTFFVLFFLLAVSSGAEILSPRDHHYQFGHKVLVKAMGQDDFLMTLEKKKKSFLKKLWKEAEQQARDGEKVSARGLDFKVFEEENDRKVVIVTLPDAEVTAEAIFVGGVFQKGELVNHVYTLEKGFERVVLGGWKDGRHFNFGAGPENGMEGFQNKMLEMTGKK